MENLIYNLMFQEKKIRTVTGMSSYVRWKQIFFSCYINCKNFLKKKKKNSIKLFNWLQEKKLRESV